MNTIRRGGQSASTNADCDTGTHGFGVRKLRPANWHSDAREAEEKDCRCEAQEVGQEETELAFRLFPTSLPLRATLPLLWKVLTGEFVPCQATAGLNVLANLPVKFMLAPVRNGESPDLTAALNHSKGNSFVLATGTSDNALSFSPVHVASLAADERFVNLNFTGQLGCGFVLHGFTNPMKHEPSCLLRHAQIAGDLVGTYSVAAVGHQPHGGKPLVDTDSRFVQDRADFNGELLTALRGAALPDTPRREEHGFLRRTVRTLNTLGPTFRRKVLQRVVWIGEVNDRFGQCFRGFHE